MLRKLSLVTALAAALAFPSVAFAQHGDDGDHHGGGWGDHHGGWGDHHGGGWGDHHGGV